MGRRVLARTSTAAGLDALEHDRGELEPAKKRRVEVDLRQGIEGEETGTSPGHGGRGLRRSMATTRWSSPLVAFGGEKEKKQRKRRGRWLREGRRGRRRRLGFWRRDPRRLYRQGAGVGGMVEGGDGAATSGVTRLA